MMYVVCCKKIYKFYYYLLYLIINKCGHKYIMQKFIFILYLLYCVFALNENLEVETYLLR